MARDSRSWRPVIPLAIVAAAFALISILFYRSTVVNVVDYNDSASWEVSIIRSDASSKAGDAVKASSGSVSSGASNQGVGIGGGDAKTSGGGASGKHTQPSAQQTSVATVEAAAAAPSASSGKAKEAGSKAPTPSPAAPIARRPPIDVVLVSDTHGLHRKPGVIKVPAGDMLLFPGDVEVSTREEGLELSRWLEGLPIKGPRVLTWGNMDTGAEGKTDLVPSATVLVNAIQEINGYRIFGSPWTPRFAGGFQLEFVGESGSDAFWDAFLPPDSDVDIILTHGPPYGIADKARGKHRGDKGLLKAVQALEKPPLLWVCGHIHEQYGEHRVPHPRAPGGSILLVNSAVYYVQKPEHGDKAQPRVVRLPEAVVLPRKV